jgi:hypothetical protein
MKPENKPAGVEETHEKNVYKLSLNKMNKDEPSIEGSNERVFVFSAVSRRTSSVQNIGSPVEDSTLGMLSGSADTENVSPPAMKSQQRPGLGSSSCLDTTINHRLPLPSQDTLFKAFCRTKGKSFPFQQEENNMISNSDSECLDSVSVARRDASLIADYQNPNCIQRVLRDHTQTSEMPGKLPASLTKSKYAPCSRNISNLSAEPIYDINDAYMSSSPKYLGLCGTAECFVKNPKLNTKVKVRALLDSGANLTMITRKVARDIGLTGEQIFINLNVAGGETVSRSESEVEFQLVSKDGMQTLPLRGITTEAVGNPFSPVSFNPRKHKYLRGLQLADKFPNLEERPFQLLISEPYFSMLQKDGMKKAEDPSLPFAQETSLGWVLRGAVGINRRVCTGSASNFFTYEGEESFELETMYTPLAFDFRKFWDGENIGLSPFETMTSKLTALEIQAEEFHKQTAHFDKVRKKWSVHLPWINDDLESRRMTDNTRRAKALYHKVLTGTKEQHMSLVIESYNDLVQQGFAEEVPPEEENPPWPTYVMTSRPVLRPDKATTKCRIVINASMVDPKDSSKSINKLLMPGPNLLPQIMELVMRLMFKKYIFLIDVRKMFLAVELALKQDKDMLRYIWGEPGTEPKLYRLKSLGFGILSSPFQAIKCLQDTAKALAKVYPEAAESLLQNTYMDDNSDGSNSLEKAKKLLQDILTVMESGGFHGHKISASHPELLDGLDKERCDNSRTVSVLGLKLDHDSNEFMFDLEEKFSNFNPNAEKITRRDIVAVASRVFDTQGFVSPYIMQYKKLLPMLWHNKTTWDENLIGKTVIDEHGQTRTDPIAEEAVARFKEWFADIPRLKELKFSRYVDGEVEKIAIFGDASKTGIGVVAYAIKKTDDGKRRSQIIYSKSTLMPQVLRDKDHNDALTIARAELVALVCCINMSVYIRNALKPNVTAKQIHIFTDSLLNLQRLQRGKGKSKPWEERRVCKVLDNLDGGKVHFCPGVQNPADLPSRGCNMSEFTERLDFWKEGPDFLLKPEQDWPEQPCPAEKSQDESKKAKGHPDFEEDVNLYFTQVQALELEDMKERKHAMAVQKVDQKKDHFLDRLLERISSLHRIRVVITAFKRFAKKFKGMEVPDTVMTREESDEADLLLARHVQQSHLSKEISILCESREKYPTKRKAAQKERIQFHKGSPLKNLPILLDKETGLLRLQSRLHKASFLSFDFKNPIILPKSDLSQRLALEVHKLMAHASQKATFNTLRQKFWCIGGYKYVKDAVRKGCLTPRCRYIEFEKPKMSPLPAIRMDSPDSWTNVGVDYMGPMNCIHSCEEERHPAKSCHLPKTFKVWAAVFTCMHTRSIHVELVPDCSTREFLEAFRRFVASKGRPSVFYSDQARTFKSADKQLKELITTRAREIEGCTYQGSTPIEWRYSTETAPWTNGCTERLVGIFKKQLQIVMQKHPSTFRSLQTTAMEVTACVNERPLGLVTEGSDDLMISPNHLVRGKSLMPLLTPTKATLSTMPCDEIWENRKAVMHHFWKRWQAEYLATLSIDNKWKEGKSSVIKSGDAVILKPETLEKGQWRIARVTEVHKNLDGVVTTASVRLPSGTVFKRTLRQIALLEPAAEELEHSKHVTEESPVLSTSHGKEMTCLPEVDGNGSPFVVANTGEAAEPLSGILPCPEVRVPKSDDKYPSDGGATAPDLEPQPEDSQENHDGEDTDEPRRKRARKRPGYYRQLAKGKL